MIGSTLQPVWNESWEVVVESGKHPIIEQTLALQMWDQDTFGSDEVMGSASLPLSSLTGTGKTDRWVRNGHQGPPHVHCPGGAGKREIRGSADPVPLDASCPSKRGNAHSAPGYG